MKNKKNPISRLTDWILKILNILNLGNSIRKKLFVGFLLMIVLTLAVSAATLLTLRNVRTISHELVDVHSAVSSLALQTDESLLKSRQREQNFLLQYNTIGFESANLHIYQLMMNIADAHAHADSIRQIARDNYKGDEQKQTFTLLADIDKTLTTYEDDFLETVNTIEEQGNTDTGLIGQFRREAHDIEEIIGSRSGLENLTILLLTMRRYEKDYLLRGGEQNVVSLIQTVRKFQKALADAPLSSAIKVELNTAADDYLSAFNQVADKETFKKELIILYTEDIAQINPFLDKLIDTSKQKLTASKAELVSIEQRATLAAVIVALAAIFLGILLASFMSRSFTKQVGQIMNLFSQIGIGQFDARAKITTSDELGQMAESLNAMLDNTLTLIQSREERDELQESIMKLLAEISALTDGDLSARAEVTAEATGALADSFNTMAVQLGRIVAKVQTAADQVSNTSKDVKTSTDNLADSSEKQAAQVSTAIAAIREMATTIQDVAKNATQSANVSKTSTESAREGSQAVDKTSKAMESIRDNVQETARSIKRLGESSQEIGNIVQIINDIAERTSILALNASIQAAMAGDAGRGFAVVAEEVQRLAERSTNSTKQIETLVTNIQGEITEAGTSMDESIRIVVDGTNLASDARKKLEEIETISTQLGELVQSITQAAQQQAKASADISKTMEEVGKASSENQASSSHAAGAMQQLADTAEELRVSVSAFKLAKDTERTNATEQAAA
jgi:twitching motility protein PilJ